MIISNKYDKLKYSEKILPLRPYLDSVLESGKYLKIGVLPGTIICPSLEQSFAPIADEDITYFYCKAGECLYVSVTASFKFVPKIEKITLWKNDAALCELFTLKKIAKYRLEEEIKDKVEQAERVKKEIENISLETEEIIKKIGIADADYEELIKQSIKDIEDEQPPLPPEEKASKIEVEEEKLKLYLENSKKRKEEIQILAQEEIQRRRCPLESEEETTTSEPTTTTTTTTTTTPETTTPEPTTPEDECLEPVIAVETTTPEPRIIGTSLCEISKEIERLKKASLRLDEIYAQAEVDIVKDSKRYYAHNEVKVQGITVSITKEQKKEVSEEKNSKNIKLLLAEVLESEIDIIDENGEIKKQKQLSLSSASEFSWPDSKPQLCVDYSVRSTPTKLERDKGVLECKIKKGIIKEASTVEFSLFTI